MAALKQEAQTLHSYNDIKNHKKRTTKKIPFKNKIVKNYVFHLHKYFLNNK